MKIYTAVYRPWHTPYAWFGRDSGLVTEGLNAIGVESRLVILKTDGMPEDDRFLPATREQFLDAAFWKRLQLAAVVLQGGGEAATEPVAQAIRQSGTKVFLRLDSDGVIAPQVDPYLASYNLRWWLAYHHQHPATLRTAIVTGLKLLFPNTFGPGRIVRRFQAADGLLIESRVAAARLRRLLHDFGAPEIARRVIHLPIPIPAKWSFQPGDRKENLIVSVARWYDAQKDAPKLVRVLTRALAHHPDYRAVVIGDGQDYVKRLVTKYASTVASRIEVTGRIPHEQIPTSERAAKIFICSSRAESMNISSAEALCCGCSVVGPAEIASMHEYTAFRSGTLAWTRRDIDLTDALGAEIDEWRLGRRDPETISAHFKASLAPEAIAQNLTALVRGAKP